MGQAARYRLTRNIGRGGMAEVVEAVSVGEQGFERRVAIKRMLPVDDYRHFAGMFLDEARIASQLHHGNIVSVLDYGIVEGTPFQVLEFVDGTDTQQIVALGARRNLELPVELALYVCTEVCHALEYAHSACDGVGAPLGIVHRDVKPNNILVSWSGEVKLTDFGIAFANNRIEPTMAGGIKGTPLYMAPEQMVRGEIDGRTDLFALGCVLQTLVGGHSPLAGDGTTVRLLAGGELEIEQGLPPDVREIVTRATRTRRNQRYRDAAEMTRALGRALAGRLQLDSKTVMREWLERVRAPAPRSPFRLDPFLDIEFVMAGVTDGHRNFETRNSKRGAAPASPPIAAQPTEVPRSRPRVKWAAMTLLGGAVAGLGAFWFGRAAIGTDAHRTGLPPAPPASSGPKGAAGPPAEAGPITTAIATPLPPIVRAPHRSSDRSRATPAAPPSQDPGTSAVLSIGGQQAFHAEIFIDGRSFGYAPKMLELPLGRHRIKLVTPDGRAIGPEPIMLTSRDTWHAPLRYRAPADR